MKSLASVLALCLAATAPVVAVPVALAAPEPLGRATPTVATVPGAVSALAPSPRKSPTLAQIQAAAHPFDAGATNPLITFMAGLPRDRTTLDAAAVKVASPGQLEYRDFATLNEAAAQYGAKGSAIKALQTAATKAKVTVAIDRTRLLARLTAPASTWQKLYGKALQVTDPTPASPYRVYSVPGVQGYAGSPTVFRNLTSEWVAVFPVYAPNWDSKGIDPQEKTGMQQTLDLPGAPAPFASNSGTLPADTCGQDALINRDVFAPSQIRQAYGTTSLAAKGMRGKGTRMTIVSLGEGYDLADIEASAHCFGYAQPTIKVQLGTGVGQAFRNAGVESHLDLITASSVLPEAESIKLLEVVNPVVSFTDALSLSLDYDGKGTTSPDVVSVSYGTCELEYLQSLSRYVSLNEDLLRVAALVGTSVLFATGDNGTSMCGPEASLDVNGPLVWYPASSPWVTAVGGTHLVVDKSNLRAKETVWNDVPYLSGVAGAPVPLPAGSGGPSAFFAHGWYQGAPTTNSPRMLPDVSLLGELKPGWPVYYGGTLFSVGGTSGATPFLGANLALMAAAQRAKGYPGLGFANPWFYKVANNPTSPFFDITVGSNAVQSVPCCSATTGYDMASGLGAPMMDRLNRSIPYPAG